MFAAGMKDILSQEMAKERDELERKIEDMEHNLRKSRALQETKKDTISWKKSYRRWDCYEDTDELECKIEAAKQELATLNRKMKGQDSGKPCDHKNILCTCFGDRSAERKVMNMETSERIEQMALFKRQGNILYTQKKYEESLPLYEKSLIYFEYCFDGTDEERQRADALRYQCLLNAASCFLHMKLYPRCVEYCNEVLEIDRNSTKAWLRRARAHRLQDKLDLAENDLSRAKESSGSNPLFRGDIQREMKLLRDDKRRYKESSTELATSMLVSLQVGN